MFMKNFQDSRFHKTIGCSQGLTGPDFFRDRTGCGTGLGPDRDRTEKTGTGQSLDAAHENEYFVKVHNFCDFLAKKKCQSCVFMYLQNSKVA